MTREEILAMWKSLNILKAPMYSWNCSDNDVERFAALVAERERADERERVIRAVEYIDHGRWTLAELRECVELHYVARKEGA